MTVQGLFGSNLRCQYSGSQNKCFRCMVGSGNQFRPLCRFLMLVFGFVRAATSTLIRDVPDVQFVTRSSLFSSLLFRVLF